MADNFDNLTEEDFLEECMTSMISTTTQLLLMIGYFIGLVMGYLTVGVGFFVITMLSFTLWKFFVRNQDPNENPLENGGTIRTMFVLGSGGHTREMLNISKFLSNSFYPRIYVASETDFFSLGKATDLEEERMDNREEPAKYLQIVRLREVGEGLWLVLFRLPVSIAEAAFMLVGERPNLLLCNGPGVCLPLCMMAWFLNKLGITAVKIVFVESICRVNELSLTGKIVLRFVNEFIVQWPELRDKISAKYPKVRVHYLGRMA